MDESNVGAKLTLRSICFGRHHFHGVRAHHRSPARAGLNDASTHVSCGVWFYRMVSCLPAHACRVCALPQAECRSRRAKPVQTQERKDSKSNPRPSSAML